MEYNKEILNRFLTGEVAIAVRTSEEWDKFMCLLEEETSVKWKAGEYPRGFNDWYIYGCNTAISCSRLKKTKLQFAPTDFYKKADVEIIEFTELIKAELGMDIEDNIISHKALLDEIHETYKEKNRKYGDSFTETVKKYGLIAAITRMHDKFSRIENIITQKAEDDEDERLVDSLKDLANYCLMTAMVLEDNDD